jgi:serine/threonine protein kinase
MSSNFINPDENVLKGYLLGTLPQDRVEQVREWLEADPTHVDRLTKLMARDPLTDAISRKSAESSISAHSIERVVRRVSNSLRTPSGTNTTVDLTDRGETLAQNPPFVWPPSRLGEYRIVSEIGSGGMGVVLEMSDERLGRNVAVKVLNPQLAKKPDATGRFMREARHAATVEHDNVVPILHVGEEAGMFFIVMPLLKGESLAERLHRDEPLPVAEVIRIGKDIAAGLAAAHAKGVIHRDMKPANVWLDAETGRARILDFGLARQEDGADALTENGALVGTPAYMSPEQVDGKQASPRSDLFALGAILYECATGKRAFEGPSITAILNAVGKYDPVPVSEVNPKVPPALSALIGKLLAKNPSERPASAAEIVAALANGSFLPPSGDYSTQVWVDRTAKSSSKRRGTILVAAGLAFLILLGVGIWLGTRDKNPDLASSNQSPPEQTPQTNLDKNNSLVASPGGTNQKAVTANNSASPSATRYRGKVDVLITRSDKDGREQRLRLNEFGALPMKKDDPFRIEAEIDPPAYLYLIWVDPGHDITPIYPWNPAADDAWATRPPKEEEKQIGKLSLPPNVGKRYTAPSLKKPGVATMVLFACPEPLTVSNKELKSFFEWLPDLPLPQGGNQAAVWFDDYVECRDPLRLRTFGEVGSNDSFAIWQGVLQKHFQGKVAFQTAVSFARTGN